MKKMIILGAIVLGSYARADVYSCVADFGTNLKASFLFDTDKQDKASVELTNGMDVGCAVFHPMNMITCTYGDASSTIGASADLGTTRIGVGYVSTSATGDLTCRKQ